VFDLELILTWLVPLMIALLNVLVAGYALATGFRDRSRVLFAIGPAGAGIWALAWFSSLFDPVPSDSTRFAGTIAGVFSIAGFTFDALSQLSRRRASILLGGALLGALGMLLAGLHFAPQPESFEIFRLGARCVALALAALLFVTQLSRLRAPDEETRKLARTIAGMFLFAALVSCALALAAYLEDRGTFVDPLLFVILLSELVTLAYIARRRVEVNVILSRALSYALLSIAVAVFAALIFARLGYPVDPVVVAVTVAIALLASAMFMGVSRQLTAGIERLLFPEQARLHRALEASKGELMALRRRLERVERLAITGELAASVAHEIKNPLAPIRGYAQLLAGKIDAVAAEQRPLFQKALGIIKDESDRIDGRIGELLQHARGDRSTAPMDELFDLHRVILETIAVAEGDPRAPAIETKLDAQLTRVTGNADEIRGALLNLLKNAIEAMDSGAGRIDILSKSTAGQAIIEILDEGPGLSADEAERVFQAFYTTKKGGTGLGLAIARTAIEAAGGTLELMPRPDRTGALARIQLEIPPDKEHTT
jgi:signal transduction histidine kinase